MDMNLFASWLKHGFLKWTADYPDNSCSYTLVAKTVDKHQHFALRRSNGAPCSTPPGGGGGGATCRMQILLPLLC